MKAEMTLSPQRFKELFPHASQSLLKANGQLSDAQPQRHETPALGGPIQREEKGLERTRVLFVGYRVRPLDPDNFAGSVKDLLDGLRHAELIRGDEPWEIILETRQEKVQSFKAERTEVEITWPE